MMTRQSYAAAACCLLAGLLLQGCATPGRISNINDACRIFFDNPGWRTAMENTRDRWRTPLHVQLAIMRQESSFRHDARPPRETVLGIPMPWRKSSAFGFSQAKDSTWDWYQTKTGNFFASRDNFADASDFIGWYTDVSIACWACPSGTLMHSTWRTTKATAAIGVRRISKRPG